MTRAGKCDTCRQRKVKCDEQKPKCTACRKRDRPCTYTFGQVSAFVVEDPTKLSKHGKATVAPRVYPLIQYDQPDIVTVDTPSSSSSSSSSSPSSSDLRVTTEKGADDGQGVFMTFTAASSEKPQGIRKSRLQQKRKLELYLDRLREAVSAMPSRLSTPQVALAARYLDVLGPRPIEQQPLALLGSWVQSIPARLGSNPVVDLAVEFFADSFNVYREGTFSSRNTALASKAKALAKLQVAVGEESTRITYDTVLAMKIHFAAEIFMGIKNLFHAIHAAGLAEILKLGSVAGFDEDHYWNLVENSYPDDVTEAMVSGRPSIYDNEYYLRATSPSTMPLAATTNFRASTAIMHLLIQLPRIVCLLRHVIQNRHDTTTLSMVIGSLGSLWMLDPFNLIHEILQTSTSIIRTPPSPIVADIVPDSLHFDSIEIALLLTRYWMLIVSLCGITEAIYIHFPAAAADSLLPELAYVNQRDIEAAKHLARCVRYSLDVCPSLPLLPLRIHSTFQLSIGSWIRLHRRLQRTLDDVDPILNSKEDVEVSEKLHKAQRMENWVADECNSIHSSWGVSKVSKKFLNGAVEVMSGGPIPNWLPTRVHFDCQDGDMVMKIEYDLPGRVYKEMYGNPELEWTRTTVTPSPFSNNRSIPTQANPYPTGIMTRLPYIPGE